MIIFALGLAAIVAAFLLMKHELSQGYTYQADPDPELEEEKQTDPHRFEKGYKYDRASKIWVPVVPDIAEQTIQDDITASNGE